LGLIYWKHLEERLPWESPIPLKAAYLKENIPDWPAVWKTCERLGLVERDYYCPHERSYGYCLVEPYRSQTHRLLTFDHKLLSRRLRGIEKKHQSRPVLQHLREQLGRLSVDMTTFDKRFDRSPNRHYYLAHLQTITDGFLRFTVDEFAGRVHTNVSNMYKPLRTLLRVDNEPESLGEIDIKNSQPLFLGLAAKAKGCHDNRYLELCEAGELYDHLASRIGLLRDSAKHEFVVALYARNGYRSLMKRVFEIEFPKMAAFVLKVKERDHTRLARQMQRAERRFILDTVCLRLMRLRKDMFITTIHDAILARKADCDLVVSVIREDFARLGVAPKLSWQDVAGHSERSA
jgi:hypothetical protein